ncbi:MAG: hypothetical protein C9356_12075 [Oleiphilus sp.]|nr:MAG: hypothetical protein C9356_12075 [Oleiphilus sp.]
MTAAADVVPLRAMESSQRQREINILVNVIQPDPFLQPAFIADSTTLLDLTQFSVDRVCYLIVNYLREPVHLDLSQPIWQVVDNLKRQFPGWPDRTAIDH